MRLGLSWLREYVSLPGELTAGELEAALTRLGIEVESIADARDTVTGSLVVGRVLSIEELAEFKKPIRFCTVDVGDANGTGEPQEIICGARNFSVGDLVVVILPGGVLPGGLEIGARRTYGHNSNGMICSARELGVSDDHTGIIVLDPALGVTPGEDARAEVGLDDIVVEVEITPDRGYQLSARGLARELSYAYPDAAFTDPGLAPGGSGSSAVASGSVTKAAKAPVGAKATKAAKQTKVAKVAATGSVSAASVSAASVSAASASQAVTVAPPSTSSETVPAALSEPWPVTVVDQIGCDRFAARLVSGLDPHAPTPAWMQRRLVTAGVRTLGLAIDITNYLMLELGQPMHAFDADRIEGPLVVRRATEGEPLTTLDGVARRLSAQDMVICDDRGPVSLAAVMGGEVSEVVPGSTTRVLFEAAHWDPAMVGRTARRHKLFSEAAKRWERGVDRELCPVALDRAVELAVRYGGPDVTVSPAELDLDYPRPVASVPLNVARPGRLIGVDYTAARIIDTLTQVGCRVSPAVWPAKSGRGAVEVLTVTPPSWRPDLTGAADLVEEVVRLDGFDKVPSVLPMAPAGNGLTPAQRRRRSVGRTLAERGFVEVMCHPFVSALTLQLLDLPAATVRLANPISEQEPWMRTSLLPPLLAALRRNVGRGQRDCALYELGLVFLPAATEAAPPALAPAVRPSDDALAAALAAVPRQPWHVAAVRTGEADRSGPWGAGRVADWSDAVRAALDVLGAAGVPEGDVTLRSPSSGDSHLGGSGPWHPGRCAVVEVGGALVGRAGELHPSVCAALELPARTVAMELDLEAIPLPGRTSPPVVSTFPPALVDVALVVDASVPAAEVQAALATGAGELLESVRLFDIYTGAPVPAGHRSLAYTLVLRARDRTLTSEETLAARDRAVASAGRLGAVLRG
jgi:phenylalanyl-tRNA synthetase beta chain